MNENCDVDVAIDRAGYQSRKRQQKTTLQVFFVIGTRPASPSGIYGSLPLPLVLYGPANYPDPQMIPVPQMTPKLDRK